MKSDMFEGFEIKSCIHFQFRDGLAKNCEKIRKNIILKGLLFRKVAQQRSRVCEHLRPRK